MILTCFISKGNYNPDIVILKKDGHLWLLSIIQCDSAEKEFFKHFKGISVIITPGGFRELLYLSCEGIEF
jgi:hypothetical protein